MIRESEQAKTDCSNKTYPAEPCQYARFLITSEIRHIMSPSVVSRNHNKTLQEWAGRGKTTAGNKESHSS